MGREQNVIIFKDTMDRCETDDVLKGSIEKSLNEQFFLSGERGISWEKLSRDTKVVVTKNRSLAAAAGYRGKKIVVHNFASATNPGGGVTKGSFAQEECLCRCSTLYKCISDERMQRAFYKPHRAARNPLHNDDCIYTPGVTVFKSDTREPRMLQRDEWYSVDVITCAAPNLREHPSNTVNSDDGRSAVKVGDAELLVLQERRFKRILALAASQGAEVVVLGAFGCGAFCNKPSVVAEAAKRALGEFRGQFEVIEFAVYCSYMDEENFKVFKRILGK